MKKIATVVLLALTMSCVTITPVSEQRRVERSVEDVLRAYNLNVLYKVDQQQLPLNVLAIISDSTKIAEANIDLGLLLESELNKSGRVKLVDRGNMDAIFEEQNLVFQGITDESSIEIGELAGAEYLLVSNVVATSQQKQDEIIYEVMNVSVTIQAKLINVSTGEVYLSVDQSGEIKEKLVVDASGNLVSGALDYNNLYKDATVKAVDSVVELLLNNFPAIGFVLKSSETTIDTDLGSKSGIKEGSRIAIINRVGPVLHPVTQKLTSYDYEYAGWGFARSVGATSTTIEIAEQLDTINGSSIIVLID